MNEQNGRGPLSLGNFIKRYPLSLLCGVFMTAFLAAYLIKPDTGFSELENRVLTGRPTLTGAGLWDGSFMESFELYTGEQLPLRDSFIRLKAFAERLLLKKENNGIVRGKDGQLFEKALQYPDTLKRNEEILSSFIRGLDRPAYLGIIPNSFEIQSDRLPAGLPRVNEKEETDAFYDTISRESDCVTIPFYDTLKQHENEDIYYRTDHHWTTLGAYYGYETICNTMDLEPVSLSSLKASQTGDFYGTYYAKYKGIGIRPDVITWYEMPVSSYVNLDTGETHDGLYDESRLTVYDKYALFLYGNPGLAEIRGEESPAADERTLIIFKDSYANCLIPFLTKHFDRILVVDLRYFGGSVQSLLAEEKPAELLFLYNFMHFSEDSHY
ncbi:MAG: hypothetical protein K6G83_11950, partial [Lachnospiraceae bacterium]|nr:hypothetical protein [Lachnospiraceae bacterium]